MARIIFTIAFLLFYFASLYANPLIIRGQAAATMYICDKGALLNCWYNRPHSYCEVPEEDIWDFKIRDYHKLVITGHLAKNIHLITNNCYDAEPPGFENLRYNYGAIGINCYELFSRALCIIDIDATL